MRVQENSFILFVTALDYIEEHLTEEFSQEDIAAKCFCSLSSLQKTWKICTHMSIKEYVSKRRVTMAGRDMLSGMSVLDAALKYGYNSHEVFTRAFSKVWGISPSGFKKEWKGDCGLYPRLNPDYLEGDEIMNYNIKKFDVRDFYDYLRSQAGTYVICFDVQHLMQINEDQGREAGDKVILEAFRRINEAAGEDKVCLRIGGDEFVMITESSDRKAVEELALSVLAKNGQTVAYSGGVADVSLRAGAIMIGERLKYSILCEDFNEVLDMARESGRVEFKG